MDDLALLRLQAEWGADEALDAEPADRLRVIVRSAPVGQVSGAPAGNVQAANSLVAQPQAAKIWGAPLPAAGSPAALRGTPAEHALATAAAADSLDALRKAIAAFDGCALRETASNLVFADGDPASGLLLIGDPPGADEDRAGKPFAGKEGALLDRMLASIGLNRTEALLAPLIPWRPPGGRPPNAGEIAACLPFLHRVAALAAPRRIVVFGVLAARALLPANAGRRRSSIAWIDCALPGGAAPIPALALPGIGTLSKTPLSRRDAWAGLRLLRRTLDEDAAQR